MNAAKVVAMCLLGGYSILILAVIAVAAYVALFVGDEVRREVAYRVLKLMVGAATGVTGLVMAAVKLTDAGLL